VKLIIANCSQQVVDFIYRLPEANSNRTQRIEIGGQTQIAGDLNGQDVDAIISQHRKYGLVSVDEIDRTKPFIGLCYAIDKKISVEKVRRALEHNSEVLVQRGKDIRQESAVAVNNALEESAPNLKALELSVIEEPNKNGTPTQISEGVRVTRHEESSGGGGRKPGRRAAR
jgi:hypothetical protein